MTHIAEYKKNSPKKTFGGILGENSNFSQIKNSYYDRMTSGYDAAVLAGKTWISYSGTAFTTDQTKLNDSSVVYDVAIYIDWDFVDETAKGSSANQVIFDPSGDLYVNGSCNYGSPGHSRLLEKTASGIHLMSGMRQVQFPLIHRGISMRLSIT